MTPKNLSRKILEGQITDILDISPALGFSLEAVRDRLLGLLITGDSLPGADPSPERLIKSFPWLAGETELLNKLVQRR